MRRFVMTQMMPRSEWDSWTARTRRRPHWLTLFGLWFAVFVVVWLLIQPRRPAPLNNPNAVARDVTPRGDLSADEQATIEIFQRASPSVVHITTSALARSSFTLDVFAVPRGAGSGVVYDTDGHIVTNYHVVEVGQRRVVRLADQSEWEAKLVGKSAAKDLAVLKIEAPANLLKPLAIGTSSNLVVGQKVLAIGNPFGLDQSLTTGVVSALGREIDSVSGRTIQDVIQTDAAINPGNSGGPLLDSAGRMIGINAQIASPSGANAGIGFAIPVDTVNRIVPQLIRYGEERRPVLGTVTVEDSLARRAGLPEGVLVRSVNPGSAAEEAGLRGTTRTQLGDIIVKIDDYTVTTKNELLNALERYNAGDVVRVSVLRDGELLELRAKLQSVDRE